MMSDLDERLSRISTKWSMVRQAHDQPADETTAAAHQLMQRYCGAVYRYLLGALKNEDAAEDLFQEFALRFVRGDFRRVSQERGRFRDYVRTVLIHLVDDYHRVRRRQPQPLPDQISAPAEQPEAEFVSSWREELVDQVWKALAGANPTYHAVLLCHVQNPEAASPEMAAQVSILLGKEFSPTGIRVTLHRAREKFAELLVEEVDRSLESPGKEELLLELKELHLLKLCESAVQKRGL